MKILVSVVAALSLSVGVYFHFARNKSQPVAASEPEVVSVAKPATNQIEPAQTVRTSSRPIAHVTKPAISTTAATTNSASNFDDPALFDQALASLISPQTSYADKQALWKQLKEAGKFNQVIAALEKQMADGSGSADASATLGQAYLKKCATIDDVRQKGIFAMRADEVFDTALGQDSSNWDARFYKAVSMSFWPAQLNKGQDVINNFQTLIQQQEAQSPQPQYALPYLWLGDQYQKAGSADSAAQIWQRGAALFPDNAELKSRIAGQH